MEGWFAKMKQMAVDAAGEAEAAAERLKREAQENAVKMKQLLNGELGVKNTKEDGHHLDSLGVSEDLLTYIRNLKIETWRDFPVTKNDIEQEKLWRLGPWQEKHAVAMLEEAEILSQFRYILCPREMPETRFWRLYFMLTRAYLKEKMPDEETEALRQFSCKPSSSPMESSDSFADTKQEAQVSSAEAKPTTFRNIPNTMDGSDGDSIGSFVVLRDKRQDVNESCTSSEETISLQEPEFSKDCNPQGSVDGDDEEEPTTMDPDLEAYLQDMLDNTSLAEDDDDDEDDSDDIDLSAEEFDKLVLDNELGDISSDDVGEDASVDDEKA